MPATVPRMKLSLISMRQPRRMSIMMPPCAIASLSRVWRSQISSRERHRVLYFDIMIQHASFAHHRIRSDPAICPNLCATHRSRTAVASSPADARGREGRANHRA